MVFSSHIFLFYFLPLCLLGYFALPAKVRNLCLTLFSYAFYGWANPKFVFIMLFSTLIDYACGAWIGGLFGKGAANRRAILTHPDSPRTTGQKRAAFLSMATNLSLLGFFKYFNFAADNIAMVLSPFGIESSSAVLRVVLPLGISFYTFQSMSYTIDIYRGHARPLRNPVDFACYVAMFPQLVAGPIVRFNEVADQLRARVHTLEKTATGIACFTLGLAKKILLANPCGKIADTAFNADAILMSDAWFGLFAYAFQIYFDFSGYSDMAIGLGLMLGFTLPQNFDAPYTSQSITEFWRRWHMSLSRWLRDYLYIPLGGNRKGALRTYANLMLVMLLGGLWHGASWNFVVWGGIHGLMLALERTRGKNSFYHKLPAFARIALTFTIVSLAWVFFRADSLSHAGQYLAAMFGLAEPQSGAGLIAGIIYQPYYLICFCAAGLITWMPSKRRWTIEQITWPRFAACALLFWMSILSMTAQSYNPFIYFIF